MSVNLDDFERDFEGAIDNLIKEVAAELMSIPEHLRARHALRGACEHMLKMLDSERAPDFIISMACQRLTRNAARLEAEIPEESRWVEPTEEEDTDHA